MSLIDLDELILKCRNNTAKEHIREAILCYKTGAFRSAIIATWLAVFFDILEKYKELSSIGDVAAQLEIESFERYIERKDFRNLLALEREIISKIVTPFEFISENEAIDLHRLHDDRNRCAHPSLTLTGEIFHPSAELVRTHIRSAVDLLLQYPATAGRKSIEIIIKEIESDYFPSHVNKAISALQGTPLVKAKETTIQSVIKILLTKILENRAHHYLIAIVAIYKMYQSIALNVFRNALPNCIKSKEITDEIMLSLAHLILKISDVFLCLPIELQEKFHTFIRQSDIDHIDIIYDLSNIKVLQESCHSRFDQLTINNMKDLIPFETYEGYIVDHYIKLYVNSSSWDSANSFCKAFNFSIFKLTDQHIKKIIHEGYKNYEVRESFSFSSFLTILRALKIIPMETFDQLVINAKDDSILHNSI